MTGHVVVFGGSGFVGGAVCEALQRRGAEVRAVAAPRLLAVDVAAIQALLADSAELRAELVRICRGAVAVINAAGNPDASEQDRAALIGANAALPGLLAAVAAEAGVPRFVHVSSAVVQGRKPILDATMVVDAFSAYAESKILGEQTALAHGPAQTVVYRPPSVHAAGRRITQLTARFGASPIGCVAAPGDQPSPQALLVNVGDAVAFLALAETTPPSVVIHPWEGLSSAEVLEALGGRSPHRIPRPLASLVVSVATSIGRVVPLIAPNARRLEMVWFGQGQARSWLDLAGWQPPAGRAEWYTLGSIVRGETTTA